MQCDAMKVDDMTNRPTAMMAAILLCLRCGLAFICILSAHGQSYSFTTHIGAYAGSADGTNSNAQFNQPCGVALDAAGNIYVADTGNSTIRKIAPDGTNWVVTTVAGLAGTPGNVDGTNSEARFNLPFGIAVDSAGTMYIADTYNNSIRRIAPSGTNWVVVTLAGGANTNEQFYYPQAVAVDSAGSVYIADSYGQRIRELTLVGTNWIVTTLAGLAGATGTNDGTGAAARFNYPSGVAVDGAGNVYVADLRNFTIRQIKPVGTNWVVSTLAGLAWHAGSADGTNSSARFGGPVGITLDSLGNLYVGDYGNYTIRKITPTGTNWVVSTLAGLAGFSGSTDGVGTGARFGGPAGIALDSSANLYVADVNTHRIRLGGIAFALQASLSGSQLILSWPILASNFVLETSSAIDASAPWTPLSNGIVASGNTFVLTNSTDAPAAFFRLHKP